MSRARWVPLALAWGVLVVCGVPALAITFSRASASTDLRAVRLAAFTPFAIALYALCLIAILVLVWMAVGRGRTRFAIFAGVVALLLVVHLAWQAPLYAGSRETSAGEPLTVMTTNLFEGKGDPAAVVEAVRAQKVDVLAVEEITPEAFPKLSAALGDQLPYRVGQAAPGTRGTMLFADRPITKERKLETRMGSWVADVGEWRVLVAHPAAPTVAEWPAEQEIIRKAAAEEKPDLILGDLNASLDHHTVRRLLEAAQVHDAARASNAGWQPTWPTQGFAGIPLPPSAAIDHVLIGDGLVALATDTVEVPGSDHLALLAYLGTPAD
ncbi:endonuclease/exonuclease/phosphatase (EEP) superfamily protein YafD [Nocardioides albertanoniae]|uniref:Endonuclease/exonuclease/phosphatase (EEP) superfamily protein YafD n=1 Tax=Nocardioides albertanoniae TaxID=1175486 RepID=A0A543AAC8_9ACTN|nr:endonuclease/exonuclease/phosphatase family protein [Nocardioides albertanoniae]TQL69552.1 endonuclease/exonuclease/phosphatase (EEP) superfamily protein YafD [Nocardioides albertanoniae]